MQESPDPRPQRLHLQTRWRRFAPAGEPQPQDGGQRFDSSRPGYPGARLDDDELTLARLHDGSRSAAQIAMLSTQQGRPLNARQVEGFAARLAEAGLLQPGTHEPLPVVAWTEAEARELGWTGRDPGLAGRAPDAAPLPPSSVPGSRGNAGLALPMTSAAGGRPLPAAGLIALGRPFNVALAGPSALVPALLGVLALLVGAWTHRLELLQSLQGLWQSGQLPFALVAAIALTHLVSAAARAHAVARWTPLAPRCALRRGFLRLPLIEVDHLSPMQHAARGVRLRLAAAPLLATLLLAGLGAALWFMLGAAQPRAGQYAALLLVVALLSWLLRANPLARRDGYLLLSQALAMPDLREQAVLALFGAERPWSQQTRRLPRWVLALYAIVSAAFVLATLALSLTLAGPWISGRFGGTGFLLFAAVIGAYMFRQLNKDKDGAPRATLGWKGGGWKLSARGKLLAAIAVVLCCFPYRYEPSGDLVVLPKARADVRALVAGDVREVLVQEGDTVRAGQVIARLRDDEARAYVAEKEAVLAQLQADLAVFKRGAKAEEVEVARQRVATARKKAQVSRENAQRLKQAFDKNSITAFEYDRARGLAEVDEQGLLEAQRALELTSSPAMADQIDAKEAQVKGATAALAFMRSQLANTEIKAPIDGRIVSGSLKFAVGTYLNRGDLLATVEDASELLAEIRLPESAIGEIVTGNGARARIWAFPGQGFDGTVRSVAPAAEDGAYGKVVRVQMSLQDPDGRLRPGMTGSAKAQGDRHLAIVVFTRALRRFLFVEVWSWLP